jgi:pimeloyl-ACP methyl ester carboxylesterase
MKLFHRTLGEGPPLVILHGLFGSSDNWQTHARVFSNTHTVYLVDQRNHGHSPHHHVMDYDAMANDLFELIAELGLRDVQLIGHSMGGKTVMRFAQQYGFLIDRMVVADMGVKKYPSHHDQVFKGLFEVDVAHCPTRKEAETRLSRHVSDQGTLQFLLKNLYWKESGLLDWRFNLEVIFSERAELMAALPEDRIDTPALFLTGGKSHYVPESDYDSIRNLAVHAQFERMEHAGHWLHAEDPEGFIARCMHYFMS